MSGPTTVTRREVLALLGGTVVVACFSDRPTDPGDDDVTVVEMRGSLVFSPEQVTIAAGTTVAFRNTSSFVHTATGDPDLAADPDRVELPEGAVPWNSGPVPGGGEYRRTFDIAGEYRYVCLPHEAQGMIGRITVTS